MCFEPLGLRATLEREAAEPEFCVRGKTYSRKSILGIRAVGLV